MKDGDLQGQGDFLQQRQFEVAGRTIEQGIVGPNEGVIRLQQFCRDLTGKPAITRILEIRDSESMPDRADRAEIYIPAYDIPYAIPVTMEGQNVAISNPIQHPFVEYVIEEEGSIARISHPFVAEHPLAELKITPEGKVRGVFRLEPRSILYDIPHGESVEVLDTIVRAELDRLLAGNADLKAPIPHVMNAKQYEKIFESELSINKRRGGTTDSLEKYQQRINQYGEDVKHYIERLYTDDGTEERQQKVDILTSFLTDVLLMPQVMESEMDYSTLSTELKDKHLPAYILKRLRVREEQMRANHALVVDFHEDGITIARGESKIQVRTAIEDHIDPSTPAEYGVFIPVPEGSNIGYIFNKTDEGIVARKVRRVDRRVDEVYIDIYTLKIGTANLPQLSEKGRQIQSDFTVIATEIAPITFESLQGNFSTQQLGI